MLNYYNKNFSTSEVLRTSFKYQKQRISNIHFDTAFDQVYIIKASINNIKEKPEN